MNRRHLLFLALLTVWPLGLAPAQTETDAIAARRAAILEVATLYATHEWRAGDANLIHGEDPDGVHVDTPDRTFKEKGWRPGEVNVGVPYKWGGFDSLDEFDRGIADGLYAGHWPAKGSSPASAYAVGVDCSGFVSRCWDLPQKQSTRSLGRLCYELEGFGELLPGDILNSYDGHAAVFKEFVDDERTKMRVVEAGFPGVVESTYDVARAKEIGMHPLRYKPLDPRWVRIEHAPASFEVERASGRWIPAPEDAGMDATVLASPFTTAAPGDWVRYAVSSPRSGGSAAFETRTVARVTEKIVEVQTSATIAGKSLETSEVHGRTDAWIEALIDFPSSGQKLDELEVTESALERGRYTIGKREFPATRITVAVTGSLLSRGTRYPVELQITAIHSPDVPLGILELEEVTAIVLRGNRRKGTQKYSLLAFHDTARVATNEPVTVPDDR